MDGSVVDGWPVYLPGWMLSSPVTGDINNDGDDEIVVGLVYDSQFVGFPNETYGGVYALSRDGSILQGWPVLRGWNIWSTPALGDIDADGYLEVSVSNLGFNTSVFHYNGTLVPGWPQATCWHDYYSSIMGDVNSDGPIDVLTTAGSIASLCGVYGWNGTGTQMPWSPKVTEVGAQAPATIADIDNDGKLELIASSNWDFDSFTSTSKSRGSLYVWQLDGDYNASSLPWPTFMHDAQRTGHYGEFTPPAPPAEPERHPKRESGGKLQGYILSSGVTPPANQSPPDRTNGTPPQPAGNRTEGPAAGQQPPLASGTVGSGQNNSMNNPGGGRTATPASSGIGSAEEPPAGNANWMLWVIIVIIAAVAAIALYTKQRSKTGLRKYQ
jgi:hypothetical protein